MITSVLRTFAPQTLPTQFFGVGTIYSDVTVGPLTPTFPDFDQGLIDLCANGEVIALLNVLITDSLASPGGQTVTTPTGWTRDLTVTPAAIPSIVTSYGALFWKRLDGSESGTTVSVPISENTNTYPASAAITVFTGCKQSGTPVENSAFLRQAATTAQHSAQIATLGDNRLLVAHFVAASARPNSGIPTDGAVELFDIMDNNIGSGEVNFSAYTHEANSSGLQNAITRTAAASTGTMSFITALIPK